MKNHLKMKTNKVQLPLLLLLGAVLLLRIVMACLNKGFTSDVGCFYSWAMRAYEGGLPGFYEEGVFADYPPGYICVLYVVGAFLHFFKAAYLSPLCLLLVKLPAILCDLGAGMLVYCQAKKRFPGRTSLILAAAYLLNPAVIYNSVVWGQVDSVFTLAVVLVCVLLKEKKNIPAYFVFAVGILLKPQTLIFSPLVLLGIYENVFAEDFSWKKFRQNLAGGLAAIGCMVLVCLPFGLKTILCQYLDTMGSYPYVSVNAYNFWSMLGLNWVSQEERLLGLVSYRSIGNMVILMVCAGAAWIFIRRKRESDRYYLTGAFLIATMFVFSVRMHERYLYPVMLLLLLAYVENGRTDILADYIGMTLFHFLNVWYVLTGYGSSSYNGKSPAVIAISLGTVGMTVSMYRHIFKKNIEKKERRKENPGKWFGPVKPEPLQKSLPITKYDVLCMAGISVFYALFAFINLGSTKVPQSAYYTEVDENIVLQLPQGEEVSKISWYLGHEFQAVFSLWSWNEEGGNWDYVQDLTMENVFSWGEAELERSISGTLCLISSGARRSVNELVILNESGSKVTPLNGDSYPQLFDEGELYPDEIGFMNSCYFDEIYYTRTAYEMQQGLPSYEWTHPPFGKILIMIGMTLLGANPFGFRFMGALFGVLMLPVLYLLARNICRSRLFGAFAAFLFAFDFMHFTQTRITTIDVFVTFFVILMYYFMEQYTRRNFLLEDLKKTLIPLGACGIAFGFGAASKWTGLYAGAGLAVIFFATLFRRFQESRYLYREQSSGAGDYWHSIQWKEYRFRVYKTIAFCILFFILIPAAIYTLSYLPFRTGNPDEGLIQRMISNQSGILAYHSSLESTHPYSSKWYEWPTMIRPILYYSRDLGSGLVRGISAFGNPLVWWAGIPAFVYMVYLAVRKRDRAAAFLCIGYLAEYLPWVFVNRVVFIYHYFPSVPFVVLMIAYGIFQLTGRKRKETVLEKNGSEAAIIIKYRKELVTGIYAAAVFGLFLLFYPVLSGGVVSRNFAVHVLRWLKTWVLVI